MVLCRQVPEVWMYRNEGDMKERWLRVRCMDWSVVIIRSYKKYWWSRWVIDDYTWVECEDGTKRRLIDVKKC